MVRAHRDRDGTAVRMNITLRQHELTGRRIVFIACLDRGRERSHAQRRNILDLHVMTIYNTHVRGHREPDVFGGLPGAPLGNPFKFIGTDRSTLDKAHVSDLHGNLSTVFGRPFKYTFLGALNGIRYESISDSANRQKMTRPSGIVFDVTA